MLSNAQCLTCDPDCEVLSGAIIPEAYLQGFNNSDLAFSDASLLELQAGANNAFAGTIWTLDPLVASMSNDDLCLYGNFLVTAEDPSVYPITLEFRIENNNCGFFPCPQIDFDTVVTADGQVTIEGLLSSGVVGPNGAFDPANLNPAIVVALANFSGTPLPAGVTVTYTSISLTETTCQALPNAGPECDGVGTGGGGDGGQGGIPTAGEWGLICLSILFLSLGLLAINMKRPSLTTE